MLEIIRRGQRWVTALFVVGVGGVFVFFIGLGGPMQGGSGDAVVRVGPIRIGAAEFFRIRTQREDQLRETMGEQFDARQLSDTLDEVTARILIERSILALEAERLGLTVAKEEVEREILRASFFRDGTGRFDKEVFDDWVSREFGSERLFRDQQRRDVLAGKLLRALRAQAVVSEGEARMALERRLEQLRIAVAVLDPTENTEDFERDPEAIAELLATREEEVRKRYAERATEFDVPEQVRARHILLRVPTEADEAAEAAVRERLLELRQRIAAGEPFAELAELFSEDPGSKTSGGDLGLFARGQMVPEFDEAAFALAPGELSEPVRTVVGFHLIRVEERVEARHVPFEDVREDLAHELLASRVASEQKTALAEQLAEAVRSGESLESAARARELTLERTGWLRRRPDGFVPGLGAAQDLMATAFSLGAGESADRVFDVGGKLALVQVLERQSADPAEVSGQLEAERERLEQEKLQRLSGAWIAARQAQLVDAGELSVDYDRIR